MRRNPSFLPPPFLRLLHSSVLNGFPRTSNGCSIAKEISQEPLPLDIPVQWPRLSLDFGFQSITNLPNHQILRVDLSLPQKWWHPASRFREPMIRSFGVSRARRLLHNHRMMTY